MKIRISAYHEVNSKEIRTVSREFEMPAVPRVNEFIGIDTVHDSYKVTGVQFTTQGSIEVTIKVSSYDLWTLRRNGWT